MWLCGEQHSTEDPRPLVDPSRPYSLRRFHMGVAMEEPTYHGSLEAAYSYVKLVQNQ